MSCSATPGMMCGHEDEVDEWAGCGGCGRKWMRSVCLASLASGGGVESDVEEGCDTRLLVVAGQGGLMRIW